MPRSGAINPLTRELTFSDLSYTFTAHPVTGKLPTLKNEKAVANAVKNAVLTNRFEKPYNPYFGSDVYARLFENFGPITETNVRRDIELAIQNFEPRAEVLDVTVVARENYNQLDINITFLVTNQADPTTLQLKIERIR